MVNPARFSRAVEGGDSQPRPVTQPLEGGPVSFRWQLGGSGAGARRWDGKRQGFLKFQGLCPCFFFTESRWRNESSSSSPRFREGKVK